MKTNIFKLIVTLSLMLLHLNGMHSLVLAEEKAGKNLAKALSERICSTLEVHGFNTEIQSNRMRIWKYSPVTVNADSVITVLSEEKGNLKLKVDSTINSVQESKTFVIKEEGNSLDSAMTLLLPYYLNFENRKYPSDKQIEAEKYFSSVALGYYRTNDNSEVLPENDYGMIFLNWKLAFDPLRNSKSPERTLYLGDFLDSRYTVSFDRKGRKLFHILDEFEFRIDIIEYGKHKFSGNSSSGTRSVYGLFTSMEYYRPYIYNDRVLWSDDIYTDHVYLQYCYWEPIAFRHDILKKTGNRELFLSYKIGIGPGQNSSLTATNITEEEEDNYFNDIFTSNWYGLNGHGDRRHNYYYSLTVPFLLEMKADKYLNSKIDFRYSFYYFQALMDSKVHDFANRMSIDYGFYITDKTTIGMGYEFWRIDSKENAKEKSHMWHRLNFKIEKEI